MSDRAAYEAPNVQINFEQTDATAVEADALVLAVPPGDGAWEGPLADVDAALDGALKAALADANFNGKLGKTLVLPTLGRLPAKRVVVTGLDPHSASANDVRRAYGAAATAARNAGATSAACPPPGGDLDESGRYRMAVEGMLLALYDFNYYRAVPESTPAPLTSWTFLAEETEAARAGVDVGFNVAAGVYLARDLVNEPGQSIYPESLAAAAREMSKDQELEYVEFDEKQLEEMGAGAIVAVGKGSERPPRMFHMTYRPSGESKGTVALVGKGITFDTGGLNLKPTGSIENMKSDMGGSAAVIGAMRAVAALNLPLTVFGIVASAENMPSGVAFRPGDVLTAMNGKTMEIISTDAEGRLVLADALVYAAREGADEMIDLATLTGAKTVAIGNQSVAVFSNNDDFAQRVVAAGTEAGELYWQLPLWDELKKQIKSDVADMKNTGGRGGGAITAALLLAEFTEGKPWVHLDIAGAALTDSPSEYTPKGATGVGVLALLNYLQAKARD